MEGLQKRELRKQRREKNDATLKALVEKGVGLREMKRATGGAEQRRRVAGAKDTWGELHTNADGI